MKKRKRTLSDWPLLEIKRQYSQDEAIKALEAEIARLKFKIGEQESEIHELRYFLSLNSRPKIVTKTVEVEKIVLGDGKQTKKAWKKDEVVADLFTQLEKSKEQKKRLEKDCVIWRNKYFDLLARQQKEDNGKTN